MTDYKCQAFIQTKFIGPTNYRGARVKATNVTSGKSVTIPWEHELDCAENHLNAAKACLRACDQDVPGRFIVCGTKDSKGYIVTGAL